MTAPERIWAEQNAHGWIALDREPVMLRLPEYILKSTSDAAIAAAVKAERERCGLVALTAQRADGSFYSQGEAIAEEIMKGPDND